MRSPVVPHHWSPTSVPPALSKLAPRAHHPQTKSEKGMTIAVPKRTGRTVLLRRKRKAGGMMRVGRSKTRSRGRSGMSEGAERVGAFGGG